MRNCQHITEDIEKGKITRLSVRDRLLIRMHLRLCPSCKQYAKDSKILDRLLRLKSKEIAEYHFSQQEKAEIIKKLNK